MRSAAIISVLAVAWTGTAAAADSLAPIKCPADDNENVTTSVGSVFQVECATDHAGGNLPNSLVYVNSLAGCIEACSTTPGCVAVALSGAACYRKGVVGKRLSNSGVNGAVLLSLGAGAPTATSATPSSSSAAAPPPPATGTPGPFYACPAGNNTLYQSGSAIFQIQCGIDHAGGNLPNSLTYPGGGLKGCADRCAATPGCVDVSMSGAACYLKGSVGKQLLNAGVNGALLVGTASSSSSSASPSSSPSSPPSTPISRSIVPSSAFPVKSVGSPSASGGSSPSSASPVKSVSSPGASAVNSPSSTQGASTARPSSTLLASSASPPKSSIGRSSSLLSTSRAATASGSGSVSRPASSFVSSASSSSFVCPAQTVSLYSSALVSNFGARYDCANGFPQSTYYITTSYDVIYGTIPFTTTSITCTPGTPSSVPARPTRSGVSVASQPSRASLSGSAKPLSSTPSGSSSPRSTASLSTPSRSSIPLSATSGSPSISRASGGASTISAPSMSTASSGINPDVPFEGLPFPCVSSICSAIAGTITVSATYSAPTFSQVVATVSVAAPEQCAAPQDFCDTNHTAPVCRPEPLTNACVAGALDGRGGFYTPPCTSSNGCAGTCWRNPEPTAKNASVTGNYTTNPDGFYFGQCVDYQTDYFYSSIGFNLGCQTSNDCGRGAVCVFHKFGPRCLLAASSTCNPGEGPSLSGPDGITLFNRRHAAQKRHAEEKLREKRDAHAGKKGLGLEKRRLQ